MSCNGYFVGQRVTAQPVTFGSDLLKETDQGFCKARQFYPGTITYINEKHRWYQVTFDIGVKECFFFAVEQPEPIKRTWPDHYKPKRKG